MVKRASIEFLESGSPLRQPVTKFGGQPVWLLSPQWPLSRQTGELMRFIGQVALTQDLFGSIDGQIAYLFMTDGEQYVDRTWEPDSGENAVIVQPGDAIVPVQELAEGPTLYRMVSRPGHALLVQEPCEFGVRLLPSEDPEYTPEMDRSRWSDAEQERYWDTLSGNKLGGTPGFLQRDEFPDTDFRTLLLQLDSTRVPFWVNFGDAGISYAFLSSSGRSGKFLWQCS